MKMKQLNNLWWGIFVLILLLSVCVHREGRSQSRLPFGGLGSAQWIGVGNQENISDSLMFSDHPAPLFRKEFKITGKLKAATLNITAAGYYLARFNGTQVEGNLLDPAWTNYSKRIYCSEYDVTSLLKPGKNVVTAMLGNGFYNLLPLRMWGSRNLRDHLPCGLPKFIARLRLTFEDGKTADIVTDETWKMAVGPVVRNSVYLGEVYDARKEIAGCNLPGFDDNKWQHARAVTGPGGEIIPAFFPAVKISNVLKAVSVRRTGNSVVADMGVNLTGVFKIHMKGKTGDTIRFRFGERLYEDGTLNPMTTVAGQIKKMGRGGPGSPAIAWQTDSYIFGKEKEVTYQPGFTFHTFRYIGIEGLEYLPAKEEINAIEFHTRVENSNYFSTSSELINNIQKACRQTFLNNLITVQSDCAAREKFGYGGDLNATSEAFIDNFDMQSFYRKTVFDWVDAIQDSIFIDTAPFVGIKYCGISWESAFLTTQYKLFTYYGDTALVRELYAKDLEWMEKVKRLHPQGIVDKGLSDHESLEKVPVQLIGTAHYLECARIMKRFAGVCRDGQNLAVFSQLEKSLATKLLDQFWRKPVPGPINRQTLFATLIYHRVIPANELTAAADSLLKAVNEGPAGHFTTGIFGTKYVLEALSLTGHTDEVFKIINSREYPGWGYMVDKGATTIWETWKESDNTYSNCHPMFGSVSEWFYRWVAGIRPLNEYPGFRKFVVAPCFPPGLNRAEASYHTPTGDIFVHWETTSEGSVQLKLEVPKGTVAQLKPSWKARRLWKVTNVNTKNTTVFDPVNSPAELSEGTYSIY